MSKRLVITLPDPVQSYIEARAEQTGASQAQVIRDCITRSREFEAYQMTVRMIEEARAVRAVGHYMEEA